MLHRPLFLSILFFVLIYLKRWANITIKMEEEEDRDRKSAYSGTILMYPQTLAKPLFYMSEITPL